MSAKIGECQKIAQGFRCGGGRLPDPYCRSNVLVHPGVQRAANRREDRIGLRGPRRRASRQDRRFHVWGEVLSKRGAPRPAPPQHAPAVSDSTGQIRSLQQDRSERADLAVVERDSGPLPWVQGSFVLHA